MVQGGPWIFHVNVLPCQALVDSVTYIPCIPNAFVDSTVLRGLKKFEQVPPGFFSPPAVLRMTKLFTRLQRGETRTMQETCLSVPGRSGGLDLLVAAWITSSLRPLQWWEKLLQSFLSLTTIMSCRLECREACWQSRELIPNYNKHRPIENC